MLRIKSKQIAEALGISEATVSLVLNQKPGVKAETRRRILEYISTLERQEQSRLDQQENGPENAGADRMHRGCVLMLYYIKHGIIMQPGGKGADPDFFGKIRAAVQKEGYDFWYREYREQEESLEELFAQCAKKKVCGMYIMAAEMKESDIFPFQKLHIPVVVGDNLFYEQGMDSFLVDNREGIRRGVDYLVDRGHSHIVYLAENVDIFNFIERREAFVLEMARRQCGDSANRIRHLGNTVEEAAEQMNHYLDEGLHKTTAFVLESSVISLGVSKALLERQIRVPRDISLVGFDAIPELSIPGINLTMIKGTHTKRHMAAVFHLLRHLKGSGEEDEMVRVYYRTRILEGSSVFDKTKYRYE